jgi:hypothetical protein
MLGFNTKEDCAKVGLDDKHKYEEYKNFMFDYLVNISKICNHDSNIVLVISDVSKFNKIISFEDI